MGNLASFFTAMNWGPWASCCSSSVQLLYVTCLCFSSHKCRVSSFTVRKFVTKPHGCYRSPDALRKVERAQLLFLLDVPPGLCVTWGPGEELLLLAPDQSAFPVHGQT